MGREISDLGNVGDILRPLSPDGDKDTRVKTVFMVCSLRLELEEACMAIFGRRDFRKEISIYKDTWGNLDQLPISVLASLATRRVVLRVIKRGKRTDEGVELAKER